MATKMRQAEKQSVDPRVDDGRQMEELLKSHAFQRYQEIISKLRDEAMYMVLAVDAESVRNRERLRTLDEIMGLPQDLIRRAKTAQEDDR